MVSQSEDLLTFINKKKLYTIEFLLIKMPGIDIAVLLILCIMIIITFVLVGVWFYEKN